MHMKKESLHNLLVFSIEKDNGVISIGNEVSYTKTVEIEIYNPSTNNINLSKYCLKAVLTNGEDIRLDIVDENLIQGRLGTGKSIKGIAIFSSNNIESIYKPTLIKVSDDCELCSRFDFIKIKMHANKNMVFKLKKNLECFK